MPAGNSRNGQVVSIYAELKNISAMTLVEKVITPERVPDSLVRATVDQDWGYVAAATSRPQCGVDERIARFDTPDGKRVMAELQEHPEVARVATSFYALTPSAPGFSG